MFTNQNNKNKHDFFMGLALKQAKKMQGNTSKNPSVGCVVVKNNCVISSASTNRNGRPHAESIAIKNSKQNLHGSDLYITLEPCSHYGKTPPCVNIIRNNRIKRVFFSINDPDERSFKKCKNILEKKNILVKDGFLKNEITNFYKDYIKSKTEKLPYVSAKLAISKDYFSSKKKGKWITNEYSRGRVHLIRAAHDCILTSEKTISSDNPKLDCRIKGLEKSSPVKIILDKNLKISLNKKIIKTTSNSKTIIFHCSQNYKKIKVLKRKKVKLIKFNYFTEGKFNLEKLLIKIKKMGFSRILVESGKNLTHSFLKKNLIDDFLLFISCSNLNSSGSNSFKFCYDNFLKRKKNYLEQVNLFGDKLIIYKIK